MAANRKADTKPEPPMEDYLVVRTYFNGVASGDPVLYEKVGKRPPTLSVAFKSRDNDS